MSCHKSYQAFLLIIFLKFYFLSATLCGSPYNDSLNKSHDTLDLRQYLYYGRVWRDIYSHRVNGNEYLYSKDFLPGAVTFNSRTFKNLKIRYDIFNDEIMILTYQGNVLELNKEMVDNYEIEFEELIHKFIKSEAESSDLPNGYVEVLYKGNTSLYTKHLKAISRIEQGKPYDAFEESQKVFLSKDGKTYRLNTKKEFFSLLEDKHEQIRTFIRSNKLRVTKKVPESFIPVLKYYDSIGP
jgi:hypothetical protein